MSAEQSQQQQQQQHPHHHPVETSVVGTWLMKTWTNLSKRSIFFYGILALLLIGVVLGISWWSGSRSASRARDWMDLESADTVDKLKKLAQEHSDSSIGQLAVLMQARHALNTEGLDKLGTNFPEDRKNALKKIEEARDLYVKVAPQLKDDPTLQAEAWIGAGKAEETLVGVAKEGNSTEMVGNLDKAIDYYKKGLAIFPDSDANKVLKQKVEEMEKDKQKVVDFYTDLAKQLAPVPKLPDLPLLSPDQTPKKE